MDLSQHLSDLKAIAPRTFDKQLIEFLIAATRSGQQPLVAVQDHDDSGLRQEVDALRTQVETLTSSLADAAAGHAQLLDICRALDARISSFAVSVERAA